MAVDSHIRLALFELYGEACQFCRKPLVFAEMQIDHIVPETCESEALEELIGMHGLPADFDVRATYNLVPSCGSDNRHKSDRSPPDAPIITLMLDRAAELAPKVEARVERHKSRNNLDKLIMLVVEHPHIDHLDDEQRQQLADATRRLSFIVALDTGQPPAAGRIHSIGDVHDFVPPDIIEVTDDEEFGAEDMCSLIENWMDLNHREAKDLVTAEFDHDDGRLLNVALRDVSRLGYSIELDAYLAVLHLSVEYMFYPPDDVAAPADADVTIDFWVELEEDRENVVAVFADLWNTPID